MPAARAGLHRLGFRNDLNGRRRLRFGGLGYGYGYDIGADPEAPFDPNAAGYEPGIGAAEEPGYYPPEPPRPCVRPLIIKIGRGARPTATPRVVYGTVPACIRGY